MKRKPIVGNNLDKKERLDSWKAISKYVDRTVRTSRRWHIDLGMPVYRIDKTSKRSRVFAFRKEIDAWFIKKASSERTMGQHATK